MRCCWLLLMLPWCLYSKAVSGSDCDITALAVKGGAIWLGTRNGYLLILDTYLMTEGRDPLLGLQQCGSGKVKCIVPVTPLSNTTSKFQVRHMSSLSPCHMHVTCISHAHKGGCVGS